MSSFDHTAFAAFLAETFERCADDEAAVPCGRIWDLWCAACARAHGMSPGLLGPCGSKCAVTRGLRRQGLAVAKSNGRRVVRGLCPRR